MTSFFEYRYLDCNVNSFKFYRDREAIFDEFNIYTMLLHSEEDRARYVALFQLDMEILTEQINVVLQERKEGRISSDEDVDNLVCQFHV